MRVISFNSKDGEKISFVAPHNHTDRLGAILYQKIQKNGGEAFFVKADSSSPEDNKLLVDETIKKYGGLEIAVNNARPYGKSAWDGKPGAIVSVSPGAIGGFGANHHLRQSLVFINVPAMP